MEQTDDGRLVTKLRIRGAMLDSIRRDRFASLRTELVDELVDTRVAAHRYDLADLLHHLPTNCSRLLQLRCDGYTLAERAALQGLSIARARTLEAAAVERLQVLGRKAVSSQLSALSRRRAA